MPQPHRTDDSINALGFIEVRGLAAAIETADAMLKSAEVRLLRQLLRDPVQTTLTVEGSLGACSAAVDAGRAAAMRMDAYIASQVMGRPAHDTADFVLKLAEAGRQPFGQMAAPVKPAPAPSFASASATAAAAASTFAPPHETPGDQQILAALAELAAGSGAQSLARRLGGTTSGLRARLEALTADGQLVKHGARYLLAKPGADDK